MWTATIDGKEYAKGILTVRVMYKNGDDGFGEAYTVSSIDSLNQSIKNKLRQLENTALVYDSIQPGEFVPPADPTQSPYELAQQEVYRLKNLISLGILKETDQEFVDAVANLKAEYAKL